MSDARFEVIVGNVGTVYHGDDIEKARTIAATYIELSRGDSGRAAGESVTTLRDGAVIAEYIGRNTLGQDDRDERRCPMCGGFTWIGSHGRCR